MHFSPVNVCSVASSASYLTRCRSKSRYAFCSRRNLISVRPVKRKIRQRKCGWNKAAHTHFCCTKKVFGRRYIYYMNHILYDYINILYYHVRNNHAQLVMSCSSRTAVLPAPLSSKLTTTGTKCTVQTSMGMQQEDQITQTAYSVHYNTTTECDIRNEPLT